MNDTGDKRQAIFESTLELIREHGFHGAPMSLVAKKAGVAAGTIYHYFESKDQLICELYNYNKERVSAVIEEAIQPDLTFQENFFRIWTNLYTFYVKEPSVLIFFEQFTNSPFNAHKTPNYAKGKLFKFFNEGLAKGIFKSVKPEFLFLLVMGSIVSAAKMHVYGKVPISKSDLRQLAGILWEGIATENSNHK